MMSIGHLLDDICGYFTLPIRAPCHSRPQENTETPVENPFAKFLVEGTSINSGRSLV